jgi:pyrroline-5-carboxylate reductase
MQMADGRGHGRLERMSAMKQLGQTIGFIGAGNMGAALIGAIIQSGRCRPSDVYAFDTDPDRCAAVGRQSGIGLLGSGAELFSVCDIVVLAVKPQQMTTVLTDISQSAHFVKKTRTLLVSIAAGYPIAKIESILYADLDDRQAGQLPIIRVMPNTPALVLAGISGMSANRFATDSDLDRVRMLLEAAGGVLEFRESQLDAVTALSGSGPAYVFYLIEALTEAGRNVGLPADQAASLTIATLKGSIELLEKTGETPEKLRRMVTSPGGTTEAALKVLEKRAFKPAVVEAIAAAADRAAELSRKC